MINEEYQATLIAERQLLGDVLVGSAFGDMRIINELARLVRPHHFIDHKRYDNQHSRIYYAMLASPEPPTVIGTAQQLSNDKKLRPGDCAYLSYLVANSECCYEYRHHAQVVLNYARKRDPELVKQFKGVNIAG